MPSDPFGGQRAPKRKKSAKERREQKTRADARFAGRLVEYVRALEHRGNAPTEALRAMVQLTMRATQTSETWTEQPMCWFGAACRYGQQCSFKHVELAAPSYENTTKLEVPVAMGRHAPSGLPLQRVTPPDMS